MTDSETEKSIYFLVFFFKMRSTLKSIAQIAALELIFYLEVFFLIIYGCTACIYLFDLSVYTYVYSK